LESLLAALATALVAKLDRSCWRFAKQPGQITPATSLVTPFDDRPRKCDMSVDLRYWRGALGGCDDGGGHDRPAASVFQGLHALPPFTAALRARALGLDATVEELEDEQQVSVREDHDQYQDYDQGHA
jgi:hypothetical protein